MKIHLFGNGKMGKMIATLAPSLGFEIASLDACDVCIDFSHSDVLFDHLEQAAAAKKALVIGTTGWNARVEEVKKFAEKNKLGIVASPNFSIGVNLLFSLVEEAAKKIDPFSEYDVAGFEAHHKHKADAPSGTALEIANVIDTHFRRGESVRFSSLRLGAIPGEHTVIFDSPCDTITITHSARNREGFARGALVAAKWIYGKQGFYTFKECMRDL